MASVRGHADWEDSWRKIHKAALQVQWNNRSFFFALAATCFVWSAAVATADEPVTGQSPIDARTADEVISARLRAERTKVYKSLDEVPNPRYIRAEITRADFPQVHGSFHQALVPDTLDLAQRAGLFIQHLGATTSAKTDYEPAGSIALDAVPPRITINTNESICGWPKYRESLPLMRLMTGSAEHIEIDKRWAEVILHSIGSDGLFYCTISGRPWDTGAYSWVIPPDGGDQYAYLPTSNGRLLGTLGIYYLLTGDEVWKQTGIGIVNRMRELVIWDGERAFFPKFVYFPNEKISRQQIESAKSESNKLTLGETERNVALWQTWIVTGLAQFHRATGYEPAKELAYGLMRYIIDQRFTRDAHFDDHFHCGTLGIHAMCELALAAGDHELAVFARKAYEYAKSPQMGAIPEIGYFAVMQHQRGSMEPMEPCSVADMTAIALKLTRQGQGDFWDDVDGYVRNCLVEAQITRPGQISDYTRRVQQKAIVGNHFGKPGPRPLEVKYNHITENLPERTVGFFSSTVYPNEQHGQPWSVTCCTGNCTRALFYVWNNIVHFDETKQELKVNLLLNRASKWADVDSYLPYTGQVEIKVREPLNSLQVRVNSWIDREQLSAAINGTSLLIGWKGNYLQLGKVKPGDLVVIKFPISERVVAVQSYKLKYNVTFRGADVVAIDPAGHDRPMFERAHYRTTTPAFVSMRRFTPDKSLDW